MEQVSLSPLCMRVFKALLDDAILISLKDELMSGYDLLLLFNGEFGISLSPGTVYSTLSNMERDGLIKSELFLRKRIYKLTDEGKRVLDTTVENVECLHEFIQNLLVK